MGLLDSFFRRTNTSSGRNQAPSRHGQANGESKLEEGMRMEREGRLEEALCCYDEAIALAPDLARAYFNRGNILLDRGDALEAIPSYLKAIELKPDSAAAHCNLGQAYLQQGMLGASVSAFQAALALKPEFVEAQIHLGAAFGRRGQHSDALQCFFNALQLDPSSVALCCRIGVLMIELGLKADGLQLLQRALTLDPAHVEALQQCGSIQHDAGDYAAAADSYRRALAAGASGALIHNNLGAALKELGRFGEAVASYRAALALDPGQVDVRYNLAAAFRSCGRLQEAVACHQELLAMQPDHYDSHVDLAGALRDGGLISQALEHCDRAISLRPTLAAAYVQKGVTLSLLRRPGEALENFRQARSLQPDLAEALLGIGVALRDLGRLSEALSSIRAALALRPDSVAAYGNLLFIQNYLAEQPSDMLLADARRFGEVAARMARPYTDWPNLPHAQRPLRVGFVSGDLGNHPVGHFLEGVLAAFAARRESGLEFFAYSQRLDEDENTQRLKTCCKSWLTTVGLSDETLAQRIRDDRIDILIDLAGHTAHDRLTMFAWKPAPVQVSWLGYFATTGVAAIDYFLADPWTLPPDQEPFFTEQVWRLPETRLCFTPPYTDVQVSALPALSNGYITFGCFNNLSKMNDAVVQLWARVLHTVPGSQLFLKYGQFGEAAVRQRTCEQFATHGIAAERLIFEGHSSRAEYLAAYHRVDIALDPFPFPGGTTTVEALWMGVPVLTLQGERFLARQGVGLLMNAGLPEWVAVDAQDYVRRAIAHACDLQALAALRARLRQQVLASPIYDAPRFAQHFETALRSIWQQWCQDRTNSHLR